MTQTVFFKLLAIFATVGLGWVAGRWGRFGKDPAPRDEGPGAGLATVTEALSRMAFGLFMPALLFRTMANLDLASLPWQTLQAFFSPVLLYTLAVYAWHRRNATAEDPAAAATLAIAATYGNAVQLGIPIAAALFGTAGLALHVALVSLHGLVLLTLLTVLAELDIARADRSSTLARTVRTTVRNAVIHPVTLPVLVGMAWNLTGLGLHPAVDETLALLASAVVPVCLVLIGLSLAQYGLRGRVRSATGTSVLKLLVLPALVLGVAHGIFGLSGTPLAVIVMMAALPVGSNALIFAHRYGTQQAQATASIVVSTTAFVATASLWLSALAALAATGA